MAQLKLPTDRTIAFATAIVSSKPTELTVREYISLLTRHVAQGRRENSLSAAYRHLDRSAFWRAECERARADCRKAEEERVDALREVEGLKARVESLRTAGAAAGAKRKRGGGDIVPYSREVVKGRKGVEEKREVFIGGIVVEEVGFGEGEGEEGGRSLMRKLYQIGLYFKPGVQVNVKDLAHHLCSTAAEVARVVVDALDQQKLSNSTTTSTDLSAIMTAAGRVVAGMLAGLQKLVRVDSSETSRDQVTYALVRMYDSLLTAFDAVSKKEALTEIASPPTDPKTSPVKSKPKSKGGPVRVNIKDAPILNALASLLSGILKQLDPRQEPHKALFEGFLFCILSKLGARIYTVNFSRPRAASITQELEAIFPPAQPDIESTPSPAASAPVRQAHLEAPYLLHLLKQSLALTPSFLNNTPATSASKNAKTKPTPKPGSVTKTTLSHVAKERLQATLVGAIFGPEGVDEDGDLFINALQMPAAGGGSVAVPRVKEAEVGEWFQGEVWRLLGWEVLGREMNDRLRGGK